MSATYQPPHQPVMLRWFFRDDRSRAEDRPGFEFTEFSESAFGAIPLGRRILARGVLRHFAWAFTRQKGGLLADDGSFWVYKTIQELVREYGKSCMGVADEPELCGSQSTWDRVMNHLVSLGLVERRWITLQHQDGSAVTCYAYRPGRFWEKAKALWAGLTNPSPSTGKPFTTADGHTRSFQNEHKAGEERRSEPNRNWEPPVLPVHRPEDWAKPTEARAETEMFPNDPTINSQQPEPALTTPQVKEAEPVEHTEQTSDDKSSGAALDTSNSSKGMLSQITYRHGRFWFQQRPHTMDELLARPAIQRSGITEADLDALIGF